LPLFGKRAVAPKLGASLGLRNIETFFSKRLIRLLPESRIRLLVSDILLFTRDIDIAVSVKDDSESEKITFDFQQSGMSILATIEQEATNRLATVRFNVDASSEIITDLMFSSSGIEPEVVEAAKTVRVFTNTHAPVAQIGPPNYP
jgi:hypothetical protein